MNYDFTRYLAAKKSVDDRALNRHVWETLHDLLLSQGQDEPLRILEVGAGIGTMVERIWDWGLIASAYYKAIDERDDNIREAHSRLTRWARGHGATVNAVENGLTIRNEECFIDLRLETIDVFDLISRERGAQTWDLLIAHAFLDLVDISSTLPLLFQLIKPGGLFYFTINFDGITSFQPEIDPGFDAHLESLYHRTMDERIIHGKHSGDSHSGRHLFGHLHHAGAELLAAGSSDWVVFPQTGIYPAEEAYFLHFIVHTFHQALAGHPQVDVDRFERWIATRHRQIDDGALTYIAHQLDFVGRLR